LQGRGKIAAAKLVDLNNQKPFFHCSGMLPKNRLYSAIMMPLAAHPENKNSVICIDLMADPEKLINLDQEDIKRLVFSSAQELSDNEERIPLKEVHLNKAPILAPPKVVDANVAKRLSIDITRCEQNWQRLKQVDLQQKLKTVYAKRDFPAAPEAEQQLYAGFLANQDKAILDHVRGATVNDFTQQNFYFSDDRYNRLLFSYKARYFYDSLADNEKSQWADSCRWRLTDSDSGYITLEQQKIEIDDLLSQANLSPEKKAILVALQSWSGQVANKFAI
jgi:exodeoxyribonuclease-1